jgi:hypothetical protein
MGLVDPQSATALIGHPVIDPTDVLIGSCSAVLGDDESGVPHWLAVSLGDGHRAVVVPLEGAAEADDAVRVAVDREKAASAPVIGPVDRLSRADQQLLLAHYGSAPVGPAWASASPIGARPSARASWLVRLLTLAVAVGVVAAVRRWQARRHLSTSRRLVARTSYVAKRALVAGRRSTHATGPLADRARVRAAEQTARVGQRARQTEAVEIARKRTEDAGQRSVSAGRTARTAGHDRAVRLDIARRRTMRLVTLALGLAAGYVMGTKAGRERFEQMKRQAQDLAQKPQVRQVKQRMTGAGEPPAYSVPAGTAAAGAPASPPYPRQEPQLSDPAGMRDGPP